MGVRSLGNTIATFKNKFGRTGLEAVTPAPPTGPAEASGGTKINHNNVNYHVFTGTAPFSAPGDFDENINRFKIESGLSRKEWIDKGWIFKEDPLGWFQWYCRFKNGRRIPEIDQIQIKRWKAFGDRHGPAVKKNCEKGDYQCRRRQRQALLQWAYDPFF